MDYYSPSSEGTMNSARGSPLLGGQAGKGNQCKDYTVSAKVMLGFAVGSLIGVALGIASSASVMRPLPSSSGAAHKAVVDTVGGPGSPLAKQVVVGMDTNVNLHRAWDQWKPWSAEMRPYWTEDMVYDFGYVGDWNFGPTHGLRGWYNGEHMHFNGALPDSQWMDFIRAATDTTCTSASYGLARWKAPFAGVPPPADHPWVKIRDLDFYLIEGNRIKINWCIIDVVDMFEQVGYKVLPPAPMKTEGYLPPRTMDGFPAPMSAHVNPEDSVKSTAIWTEAVKEDYLLNTGGAQHWGDEIIWYGPAGVGTAHSRLEYKKHFLDPLHAAFSDVEMQTDLIVCEGKFCGAHFLLYGTHTGEWLGEKPTGKRIPIRCGAHAHIEDGKIVEGWLIIDIPRAFHHMGVDLYARARQVAAQKGAGAISQSGQ